MINVLVQFPLRSYLNFPCVSRKIRTHLDLLSIPRLWGKNVKTFVASHQFISTKVNLAYILILCVCFLPIHSGHQVRWTYQPGSHRRKFTGFLIHLLSAVRALIFIARRIQPFLSLLDCEIEFCVLTVLSFSTRWVR